MAAYTYSVIIPHYGIPDLLMRCLASIPEREDIQVIVVDDGSPDAGTYIRRFPELSRPDLIWIAAPHNGGAGYARNLGLGKAEGKWLVFADADDYFLPEAWKIFDRYAASDNDLICFRFTSALSDDLSRKGERNDEWDQILARYTCTGDDSVLRYSWRLTLSRMIRKRIVDENGLRFEQVQYSNDAVFSAKVGWAAGKVAACLDPVYCLTKREGSLIWHFSLKPGEAECRFREACKEYVITRPFLKGFKRNTIIMLHALFWNDRKGYDRCFHLARTYGFPRWAVVLRVAWNAGSFRKGLEVLGHSLALQWDERCGGTYA
ncbi:MAG: glycosyltransferase family 2 protein [Bacteroidales bacterium]|nr:glycosyltransferase family 2 protein [Bacteroidales bacterium]